MRLWLDGAPGLDDPAEELALRAHAEVTRWVHAPIPVYEGPGLSVHFRFVYLLPEGPLEVRPTLPPQPATPTLAWFWCLALEGILWGSAGQIAQVTARKEWGRVAGVEVNV